jgi:hypothetical protein
MRVSILRSASDIAVSLASVALASGVSISMERLIAEHRFRCTGALQVKTGVMRICHGNATMHLHHFVADQVERITDLYLGQTDQGRGIG